MCVTCRGALFHHGMGGAVEERVVDLAGLLTSAVLFKILFIVKHRLCDHAFVVTCLCFHLAATFSNDKPTNAYFYLFSHPRTFIINYSFRLFSPYVALPIVVRNYVQL